MIIVIWLVKIIQAVVYVVFRPIVWLITARDCKRCKHGYLGIYNHRYCDLHDFSKETKCSKSLHKCYFERESYFL